MYSFLHMNAQIKGYVRNLFLGATNSRLAPEVI